jgi:ABC-type Fe3+ transport system permease subunit
MPAPATGTALLILVAFVLPGFVTLLINERTHVIRDTSNTSERILLALYYSVLCYALLAVVAWLLGFDRNDVREAYDNEDSIGRLLEYGVLLILAIPFVIATTSRLWLQSGPRDWLIRRLRINPSHRTPTAWDHFFEQQEDAGPPPSDPPAPQGPTGPRAPSGES